MFGHRQLLQLIDAPLNRQTVPNAELVVAYMRYGGCRETCLEALLTLPRVPHRAQYVLSCCRPPYKATTLACMREYLRLIDSKNIPRTMYEDLAFSLRFTPELAETILDMLARFAPLNDDMVLPCVMRCLYQPYRPEVRMAAAQALMLLCTDNLWLGPHVMALVALVPHGPSPVRVLSLMPDRAAPAIPELVKRGPGCNVSVALLRLIAEHHPRQIVVQGGFTVLMRAGMCASAKVLALFQGDPPPPQSIHEALAYMHCTMTLPPGVESIMCCAMNCTCTSTRAMFAVTYDMARDTANNVKPAPPCLPDFDPKHTGLIELVPADSSDTTTVLLAPLARAASYIAAHDRQVVGHTIEVAAEAKLLPKLLRALLYDELPTEDTLSLVAIAELANMWCAPRLQFLAVDALIPCMGFYELFAIVGQWPDVQDLLRYHAIEFLPCLAKHEKVHDLRALLWPSATTSGDGSGSDQEGSVSSNESV